MNDLLALLGIESWKPVFSVLLLPPVPFLLLVLIGARLILPRRGLGWFILLLGVSGLWLSASNGTAQLLNRWALKTPPALNLDQITALKKAAKAGEQVAIIVLGGGAEPLAPEYGVTNLAAPSLERLRYGLWLGRETGLPVGYSGGVGWGQTDAQPEAQAAARIAAQEFGRPLKWQEDTSRDTRENGIRSIALLKPQGITKIVLVTHGSHMPRSVRAFEAAAGGQVTIQAAPMGLASGVRTRALDWMPSVKGFTQVSRSLHELVGLAAGA